MDDIGYIYIRIHESYDIYGACKLGKASNIPDRDSTYRTGEIKRGTFIKVFKMDNISIIEQKLQQYFNKYNIYYDSGTEFYKKDIIELIEPYFKKNNIEYKLLSKDEIDKLLRKEKSNEKNKTDEHKDINIVEPRLYQQIIIDKSYEHYLKNDKGILCLTCGVGKTLLSLWIAKKLNCQKILIGVPNTRLLSQWSFEIKKIFDYPILIVSGNINETEILNYMKKHQNNIIVTTYASCYKILSVCNIRYGKMTYFSEYEFDMIINDECHHLTKSNDDEKEREYVKMLKIPTKKQLSLTATLKQLDIKTKDDKVISNDNIELFGEIIDKKELFWAIENNIICNYVIQTIMANEEDLNDKLKMFEIVDDIDKRLFLSAYTSLKSIISNQSHHLLIYSNDTNNSKKVMKYIDKLLEYKYFDLPELYYSNYFGDMNESEHNDILKQFEESKYGIIGCVYCLGEGWDLPLLDAVVFSETMSSNIRIVQSALRASRKNKNEPTKITKIILPILNTTDLLTSAENQDMKKIREVIYQMGLEDEMISQKIKASKINVICKNNLIDDKVDDNKIDKYDEELSKQIQLKTMKRLVDEIDIYKKMLIKENERRYYNGEELIETTKKIKKYMKEKNIEINISVNNIIKYAVGNKIFEELKKKYYYDVNELSNACNKHNIYDIESYKLNIEKDKKFPPYEYFNNGFYAEFKNINLSTILSQNIYTFDY